MQAKFVRIFRTTGSERFLLQDAAGEELGLFDLHFLNDGTVAGNLFVLQAKVAGEAEIRQLLDQIDEQLVPTASFQEANLTFTVTQGELVGTFSNDDDAQA